MLFLDDDDFFLKDVIGWALGRPCPHNHGNSFLEARSSCRCSFSGLTIMNLKYNIEASYKIDNYL